MDWIVSGCPVPLVLRKSGLYVGGRELRAWRHEWRGCWWVGRVAKNRVGMRNAIEGLQLSSDVLFSRNCVRMISRAAGLISEACLN